ncbi:MAG: hypothetical protein L0206_24990, partial [Actinobacteria bacterium]|nr:hypothetical protein [Actinomycetota bacterium]
VTSAPPAIEATPTPEPEAPSAPPGEGWLEAALEVGIGSRSLEVTIDPDNPTEPAGSNNTKLVYRGGAYIDGGLSLTFFPFRLAQSGPRGLGVSGRYLRALSVRSKPIQDGDPAPDTTVEDVLVAALFDLPLGEGPSPLVLRFSLAWNRFAFVLEENPHLPDFAYSSIRPGLSIHLPIAGPDFGLLVGAGYRIVSGPGDEADADLGSGDAGGFDLHAGARGDFAGGLYWMILGEYLSYSVEFQSDAGDANLHRAIEGSDSYLRARGVFGYRFE